MKYMEMKIAARKTADYCNLIKKYHLEDDTLVNLNIGYDNGIYLLFSAQAPERIQGMFVNTCANTKYKALCLWVDWSDGSMLGEELLDFGRQKMNFHFIQPMNNQILLLGARTRMYKDGTADQNAVFLTRQGKTIERWCMGDGIDDCLVTEDGHIITSYFDEGIFGNFSWDQPLGASGLAAWNDQGKITWKNTKYSICDCYAINIDERNNLWFYYYDDFKLIKADFVSDIVYEPKIQGSSAFLIQKSHCGVIMSAGYRNNNSFYSIKLLKNRLGKVTEVKFTEGDNKFSIERYRFRSSKAVFLDSKGRILTADVI